MELRIEHLSKTYPNGTKALQDVSLSIGQGMFGLLGPNGAGKSTLMRTLATLQEADSGTARLGDLDVLADKEAVRRTLGYLPQEFGLYPKVSALALLDHFAILKGVVNAGERKELVKQLLWQTNLWDARHKNLGGYSGGMRQRFGIAVALIGSPKLIIVDEPTAGLDPTERSRFLNLLGEIGENSVVILSTHIVEDVAELCSRMAIINNGRVVKESAPADAVAELNGRVWRKLVNKNEVKAHQEAFQIIATRLLGGRVLLRALADACPGEGFSAVEADLEDVYFAAISGALGGAAPVAAAAEVAAGAQ